MATEKLQRFLAELAAIQDRDERMELLIETAARFEEVPARIATRPYPESNLVPGCQSEAYVFAEPLPNGTLQFFYAVENPQGISAKAMAVILDENLSGEPLSDVATVSSDIVYDIFGKSIAMGKGQGLMGMIFLTQALARGQASDQA
ncbi:MAG: SufE family protein [Bdellovibrionota bacterium]